MPRRLAEKVEKGRLDDPILRQFLPTVQEERDVAGFTSNPVGDLEARSAPRLLKKYAGRLLLLPTSACAMHCRYCFRRDFSYSKEPLSLEAEFEAIESDKSLSEVILSGGDPLSLSDRLFEQIVERLESMAHIRRLRIHSRFLIGIPERVTDRFLEILDASCLQSWFVLHCNHPRELDEDVVAALGRIGRLGIPLLNQAVLLRGVNDDLETLQALFERLIDVGVQPYYLHQLDRVAGSAHFEVDQEEGFALMRALEERLPGYGVPRYVQEVAGLHSKSDLRAQRQHQER